MNDTPKGAKGMVDRAVHAGRLSFLGDIAYRMQKGRDTPAPAPVTPSPQKAAAPVAEPARGVKPAPAEPRETRGFEKPAPESGAKPFNERTTLMPPPPPKTASADSYPRPQGGRTTPTLNLGAARDDNCPEERGPTMIPAQPIPEPAGFVQEPGTPDSIVDALFNATSGPDRSSRMLSISQGVSPDALAQGTAPMEMPQFLEHSMAEARVEEMKRKIPPRFVPYIESAMEVLAKNMKGYEPLVKIMMSERRWTHQQEETLGGALSACSDELQRIFSKMYKQEAVKRVRSRKELKGLADPGEVEKLFAYRILSTKHANANRETNVFDAFAKGAMFVFLSQQRPRTFMHALGHPEISKPYGAFGGVEGLGVMLGLDLPDPRTESNMPNPLIGLGFRLYSEVHLSTLRDWLTQVVSKWPKPQTVGRFEHMVKQDVDEFQKAIADTRFNAEMFFQVLGREDHSKLRADNSLNALFEEAAKGAGSMIYSHADDVFDALEAVVGYMNMLKHDKTARTLFLESYLANYPLGTNGGTFYKMFGMSLFNEKEDIERHPEIVEAFQGDPDLRVQFHIRQKLEQLEVRQTLLGMMADRAAAADSEEGFEDLDFGEQP